MDGADGTPLGGFAYTYDVVGRITARRHALGTNRFDRAYAYDDLDRLAADGSVSYAYDAAGNRTAKTGDVEGAVAYTRGVGDRLASWTGGAYTYDAAGNVTRIVRAGCPTLDPSWNGRYQLVSVATNGVFAEGYAYDALGRRASTTTWEGTVRHVYDDNWQVIADLDSNGNVLRSYVWGEGIDRLLAVKVGAKSYAALTDVQGTVWGLADGTPRGGGPKIPKADVGVFLKAVSDIMKFMPRMPLIMIVTPPGQPTYSNGVPEA